MFDLAPIKTVFQSENREWLRDVHGLNDTIGLTLNGDLFPTSLFPDSTVPSGIRLGRVTATNLGGPYDPAATDGREKCIGHLLDSGRVAPGRRVSGAVVDHGAVLRNRVPNPTAINAAGIAAAETALPRIRYTNG